MRRWWRWFIPGYLFGLPLSVLGLLLVVVYRPQSVRWSDGCLELVAGAFTHRKTGRVTTRIWGRPGAQTLGWVVWYRSELDRHREGLRVHERVHVAWSHGAGPVYAVVYALTFFALWTSQGFRDWGRAYKRSPFERQADRVQDEFNAGRRPTAWGSIE